MEVERQLESGTSLGCTINLVQWKVLGICDGDPS